MIDLGYIRAGSYCDGHAGWTQKGMRVYLREMLTLNRNGTGCSLGILCC